MNVAEKLITIANNVDSVYQAGVRDGRAEGGYEEGYSAGEKAEHDQFWEALQQGGSRTNYSHAFSYWTDEMFNPLYDIVPVGQYGADYMFQYSTITNLKERLEESGAALDLEQATRLNGTFDRSTITELPPINAANFTALTMAFYSASALTSVTIEDLSADCTYDRVFTGCRGLVNLSITGTIGQNGFSVADCTKLTKDSLLTIIDCLSEDGSGKTVTLGSTNLEKLTDDEKAIGTAKGWTLA